MKCIKHPGVLLPSYITNHKLNKNCIKVHLQHKISGIERAGEGDEGDLSPNHGWCISGGENPKRPKIS